MGMDDDNIWASMPPSPMEKPEPPVPLAREIPGSVFLISAAGEILKLPIPSNSHRDPLTWTWTTRIVAFVSLILCTTITFFEVKLPAALMTAFEHEFNNDGNGTRNVTSINSLVTITTSIGYLIAIPMSTAVGRRPVLLTSCLITMLSTVTAGFAYGYAWLIFSICAQGLAIGMTCGSAIIITLDATFVYERPYAVSILWCVVTGSINLLLTPLPYITDVSTHWRPIYVVWVTPTFASLLLVFFFVPETFFLRPPVALDGRILVQSASENVKIYADWESVDPVDLAHQREAAEGHYYSIRWDRLKITRAPGTDWKAARAVCIQMALCLANPLVIWVSLLGGVILGGVIFLNITQVIHLMQTLEGRELSMMSAYTGISGGISSLIAIPAAGPLIAWATRFFTIRSGGTRHAEVYLVGFILPVITAVVALGVYAAATTNLWAPWVQYFVFGLANFAFLTSYVSSVIWVTEAFPPWAAASLAIVMAAINMLASVVGINLTRWAIQGDIIGPCILLVILILVLGAIAVPIAFWGKSLRQRIDGKWSACEKGALRPQ
ncbi:major facilitator superfamily domain-containing protein [Plectosphaerella plurivora]|uniref:Major facilitator superfamily domain-containing protein n=1 Tax=Plectosphaerella plurivora TaxID=936078 RepID=A0A9P8V7J0_9PEZI|nr:major facilitator superfamily domain-containing protein [Plectosphaerella plurivora]